MCSTHLGDVMAGILQQNAHRTLAEVENIFYPIKSGWLGGRWKEPGWEFSQDTREPRWIIKSYFQIKLIVL